MARRALVAALPALALTIALLAPSTARAQSPFPSDDDKPKLAAVLVGFRTVWRSSGDDDLTGRVRNAQQLQWNDRLTSWINQHGGVDPSIPFGGTKASGYGLESGLEGLKAMAATKVIRR